ncbi:MAG: hypothetical protein Q7U47_08595 [Paludibacter sp.]|nr:hypothetical protein [Paludibacter sp.]
MIREIINFTENLIADIPDIMQWKVQPSKGLHVFIEIDENGQWTNKNLEKGIDYDYYDGKNQNILLWYACINYQGVTDYITMNKVQKFDPKQKIHSCSPFSIAFNFNFNDDDKKEYGIKNWKKGEKPTDEEKLSNENLIREKRIEIILTRVLDYKKNAVKMFFGDKDIYTIYLNGFFSNCKNILDYIQKIPEFKNLTNKDYLRIYLKSIPFEEQQTYYSKYLQSEIFNDDKLTFKELGVTGFQTTFADKKPFLKHKTSSLINGVNQRYTREDALMLNNFEKLIKRKSKCLPNPLPIVIDNRELNKEIVKIFNSESEPLGYRELLIKLFNQTNKKYLPNYYLINYSNTASGLVFNDIDFVPLFRFNFENNNEIFNVTQAGISKDKVFEVFQKIKFESIFDFERIVVREIFNNSLIVIGENKFYTNYFGDIKPRNDNGGQLMYQMIMKYRKAFYNYIYKSQINAIDKLMFDEIMYNTILSNIKSDEIKGRFEWNNTIKKKINIWFSLYNLFNNNNLIENNMAAKVTELISKMSSVAKGETTFETSEEFAFGAGQIVSYLIDRSAASNKTYALLEPYLQKNKSNQLQDAIAQTIAVYKHDISVYKGKFERLASQVLTDDCNTEMKPLLKYFLAGCFSPCVIYEKAEKDSNNN